MLDNFPKRIDIYVHVEIAPTKITVEHVDIDDSAATQKAVDDVTAQILANNQALTEVQKGG